MRLPTAIRRVLAALPDLGLAALFVAVWWRPGAFEPGLPAYLSLLMMVEFVLMHAGFVLRALADAGAGLRALGTGAAAFRARRLRAVVVGAFVAYAVFCALFVQAAGSAWPLAALCAAFAAKAGPLLLAGEPEGLQDDRQLAASLGGVAAYLLAFFVTAAAAWIPPLGFAGLPAPTPELPGLPVWQEAPYRLCAFGAAYFSACAVLRVAAIPRDA